MFGWLSPKPTCPVEPEVREWVESRWAWLCQEFGPDRPRKAELILPTPHYFPDPYDPRNRDSIRNLFDRVARYMGLDPRPLKMSVFNATAEVALPFAAFRPEFGTAAGVYDREGTVTRIWVEQSQLDDPVALVATFAHELGHELLLGHGRLTEETADHEPITDLVMVFLGLGVFGANAAVRFSSGYAGGWSYWTSGRQGYLDLRTFGYAFALFARMRGEVSPAWARELRLDVRSSMKQGLRFLADRNDPRFAPPVSEPRAG
jgi:hypothetical protein